jgi:hypothetical protein
MAKKRYDNGEIVTTGRIEDEDWYRNLYQPFLELANGFYPDVDDMFVESTKFLEDLLGRNLTDQEKEKVLRWSVLHAERMGGQSFDF